MTTFFFIGDGAEVLGCEAYEKNAYAELKRLTSEGHEDLDIYSLDPSEFSYEEPDDNGNPGKPRWTYPQERFVAEKGYKLPSFNEAIACREEFYCNDNTSRR